MLSVSTSKLYEMVEKGEIEHHRIGGAIRFTEENVNALLEETKRERREPEPCKSQPRRPRLKHVRL
jgi:excisionase family DNA binding protein